MSVLRLPLRTLTLLGAGLVYGLAPYLVNFQNIARAAFPWFVNPNGLIRSSCGSTRSPTSTAGARSLLASADVRTDPGVLG